MIRAAFPGSFDPPTNGHLNLIERASKLFDEVCVVVAVNPDKAASFSAEERKEMLEKLTQRFSNVSVHICEKLIVEYAEELKAQVILRGLRALTDFGYEFELAMTYKDLSPEIDVIFLPTDPRYFVVRASIVKELAKLDGKISDMVPPVVENALRRKYGTIRDNKP